MLKLRRVPGETKELVDERGEKGEAATQQNDITLYTSSVSCQADSKYQQASAWE